MAEQRKTAERAGGGGGFSVSPLVLIGGAAAVALATGKIKIPSTQPPSTQPGAAVVAMSAQMVSSDVAAGQYSKARVTLHNTGGRAASVIVSGVTKLSGNIVGHWQGQTVSVPAGQSKTITMQSVAPISTSYEGDTLQVIFTGVY